MAEQMTSKSAYGILRQYLRARPELGFGKSLLDVLLHPANPFDARARRKPRGWFVLLVLTGCALLSCVVYFNNLI